KLRAGKKVQKWLHIGGGELSVCLWIVLRDPFRQSHKFSIHLVDAHTRLQPTHDGGTDARCRQIVSQPERKFIVKRHPELLGNWELKVWWHYADDGGGLAINSH